MADIVIKIDDNTYEAIKHEHCILSPQRGLLKVLWDAIKNGTPLPKGMADVDAVVDSLKGIEKLHIDDELRSNILNALYTNTLEADKESEDENE